MIHKEPARKTSHLVHFRFTPWSYRVQYLFGLLRVPLQVARSDNLFEKEKRKRSNYRSRRSHDHSSSLLLDQSIPTPGLFWSNAMTDKVNWFTQYWMSCSTMCLTRFMRELPGLSMSTLSGSISCAWLLRTRSGKKPFLLPTT